MINPFVISFGKKPVEYISRMTQTEEIINNFIYEPPTTQAYMITGIRGSGKTVALSNISMELKKNKQWIVIELNPTRDMLNSLAEKLYALPLMHEEFVKAKIDLSLLGIGISVEHANKYADVEQAISQMLSVVQKKKKKILITIDEVTNNQYMREFVSSFQIFIRNEYPVYLIMAGLFNNINNLRNNKSITFLYRTPRIKLGSLNISAVTESYKKVFSISYKHANDMANLTKGYPFAFQVLGYVLCRMDKLTDQNFDNLINSALPGYDQILQEYAYEKIWMELSGKEKQIIETICKNDTNDVRIIRDYLNMDSNNFSTYSERMKNKGVLTSDGYGRVCLSLPRFENYVNLQTP